MPTTQSSIARWAIRLGVAGAATAAAISAAQTIGIVASRFSLSVDGREIGSFSELQSITSSVPDASAPAGQKKWSNIVLKRGLSNNMEMSSWHDTVLTGNMNAARKSASLVMYDVEGKPVARYHLESAWPSKVEIGALKAGASEVLMETVTISTERIERVSP